MTSYYLLCIILIEVEESRFPSSDLTAGKYHLEEPKAQVRCH